MNLISESIYNIFCFRKITGVEEDILLGFYVGYKNIC